MSSNYPTTPNSGWRRPTKPRKPATVGLPTSTIQPTGPTQSMINQLISEFQNQPRTAAISTVTPTSGRSGYGGTDIYQTGTASGRTPSSVVPGGNVAAIQNFNNGSTSNTAPPIGDKWDGFASRYVPGQRDLLFGQNSPILHDWLNQNNENNRYNYNNMEGDLQRYGDIAPRLYELLIGGNTNSTSQKDDVIINWMADFFKNQGTVGGRSPEVSTMLNQLFAGFNDKTSTLGSQMWDPSTGDPVGTDAQIANVMRYLPLVGEFSNSSYATSIYAQAQRLAQEYRGMVAKTDAKDVHETFTEYLQRKLLKY